MDTVILEWQIPHHDPADYDEVAVFRKLAGSTQITLARRSNLIGDFSRSGPRPPVALVSRLLITVDEPITDAVIARLKEKLRINEG